MTERSARLSDKELGYIEALASWIVRYLDPSGYECRLLLEAETGMEVLAKGEAAIARLIEMKCTPLHNGNHSSRNADSPPIPKTVQKVEGEASKKLCPIHNIEMQLWQKGAKTWYSHRWEGGWCRGEAV